MRYSILCAVMLLLGCSAPMTKTDTSSRNPAANPTDMTTRDGKRISTPAMNIDLKLPDCPENMSSNEECLIPGETALFDEVVHDSVQFQSVQNPSSVKVSQRDFHPRQHACLAGVWRPNAALATTSPKFAKGIFAMKQTAPVVLRFSNGSPKSPNGNNKTPPDFAPDARGLAIKVVGIPGQGILDIEDPESGVTNQDFVMINYPAFFLRTPKSYPAFLTSLAKAQPFFSIMDPLEISVLKATNRVVPDVMAERFWTQTPYKLGDGFAKLSVRLCKPETGSPTTAEEQANPRFLRERIRERLLKGPICLAFMAQAKTANMKVEDAAVEWKESESPFVEVARIEIPGGQDINNSDRDAFCENISFNPWNSLKANRPAGAMNRARLAVYSAVSRKRRLENSVPIREPKTSDKFFDVVR